LTFELLRNPSLTKTAAKFSLIFELGMTTKSFLAR